MSAAWAQVPLCEILKERRETPDDFDLVNGRVRIVDKVSFNDGRIHLRYSQDTKTGMILVRPGDLLVSGINAAKGAIAIHGNADAGPLAATIHYGAYQVDPARAETKFLWWMLRSKLFREILSEHVPGGIKTELKAKRLLPVPVPLPPLDEQRRIVARIEELAAKVERARNARLDSAAQAEHIFPSACELALKKAALLGPDRPLADLVENDRGISYGIVQTGLDMPSGIPTLRAGDLRWFNVNTVGIKHVDPLIAKGYLRTTLRGGELLLRIRGGVGELAICPQTMAGGNVSREIAVIPLTNEVLPSYAMFLLAAPTSQRKMHGNIRGTSYLGINLKDVRQLRIPVPPVAQQQKIAAELDEMKHKVDTLKSIQVDTAAELDALLPAILDKAFKGGLQ